MDHVFFSENMHTNLNFVKSTHVDAETVKLDHMTQRFTKDRKSNTDTRRGI